MSDYHNRAPVTQDPDWPRALGAFDIPAPSRQFSARIIDAARHTRQRGHVEDWRSLLRQCILPRPALGFSLVMTLGLVIGWQLGDLSLITLDENPTLASSIDTFEERQGEEWQGFALDNALL